MEQKYSQRRVLSITIKFIKFTKIGGWTHLSSKSILTTKVHFIAFLIILKFVDKFIPAWEGSFLTTFMYTITNVKPNICMIKTKCNIDDVSTTTKQFLIRLTESNTSPSIFLCTNSAGVAGFSFCPGCYIQKLRMFLGCEGFYE